MDGWLQPQSDSSDKGAIAGPVSFTVEPRPPLISIIFPVQAAEFRAPLHRRIPIQLALEWQDEDLGLAPPSTVCLQLDESPEQCLGVDILASGQLFLPSAIEIGLHALWVWYPGAVERSAAHSEFRMV